MKKDIKNIFNKKYQDYTYAVLFFMVFSIFIFFAISPSLKTAFSLKKEREDLEKIDKLYESKIVNISEMQNKLEENRDKLNLIDKAVSQYPQVNKMVDDVKKTADKNNFFIQKANIADINLFQSKKELGRISLIIEGKTDYENLMNFIREIFDQKRLKTIENLTINQDKESTNSGRLQISLIINGYYL
ncbi:MAG: type 4a pilus biogenesis protein PilO [Patescibacteria group bacterium]|nr:type 4a pilus biogenesis protein PilO [Patescibacteria group bacterium]